LKNNFTTPLDNLAWQQAQPHVLDLKRASHEQTTIGAWRVLLENVIHLLVLMF
jgi:hypothetical protein